MPIVKKAPEITTREIRLEEPVNELLEDYARFIESNADHVINAVLKKVLWRDQDYRKWREEGERDAKGPRVASFHFGRPRHGRRSIPVLHAPFPRSTGLPACYCRGRSKGLLELQIRLLCAPIHHTLSCVLDRALGSVHLYSESAPDNLARTPSPVPRPQYKRGPLSCRR